MSALTQPDFSSTAGTSVEDVTYGLLYNWYAVVDIKNIAALGWHVPTYTEFDTMRTYIGGADFGGDLKETGLTYWNTPNDGATNSTNFNARGAGRRYTFSSPYFVDLKNRAYFWLYDGPSVEYPWCYFFLYNNDYVVSTSYGTAPSNVQKYGNSVRLIKDSTDLTDGQESTYIGNDGKIYRTICIGTQEWLADSLCETKYRDDSTIPEVTLDATWNTLTTGALCAYDNNWSNV